VFGAIKAALGVLLGTWKYILASTENPENDLEGFIQGNPNLIPVSLALVFVMLIVITDFPWGLHRSRVRTYINYIRQKYLPELDSTEHEGDFRITFWIPCRPLFTWPVFQKHLRAFERADGGGRRKPGKTKWCIAEKPGKKSTGVAGKAWRKDTEYSREGLPDFDKDPEDYCKKTFMTMNEAESLNWKARSFWAYPIEHGGDKIALIMIEGKGPQSRIRLKTDADKLGEDIRVFREFVVS
jgi:hypothetical protein